MPGILLVYAFMKIKTDFRLFGVPISDFLYNSLAALGGVDGLGFLLYSLTHKRPYAAVAREGLVVSRSGRRGHYLLIPWSDLAPKVFGQRFNNPLFEHIRDASRVSFEIHIGDALALHIRRRVQNLMDKEDPEMVPGEEVVAIDAKQSRVHFDSTEGAGP